MLRGRVQHRKGALPASRPVRVLLLLCPVLPSGANVFYCRAVLGSLLRGGGALTTRSPGFLGTLHVSIFLMAGAPFTTYWVKRLLGTHYFSGVRWRCVTSMCVASSTPHCTDLPQGPQWEGRAQCIWRNRRSSLL